jgi:hypothetical protein
VKDALRRRLLWVAATDATFEPMLRGDVHVVCGRCIHCGRKHQLGLDGTPLTRASLEHIVPRHHGGTNRAENLAIACEGCNAGKGRRLDCRRADDPDLVRVVEMLQSRRRERWREAPAAWDLPPPPPGWA